MCSLLAYIFFFFNQLSGNVVWSYLNSTEHFEDVTGNQVYCRTSGGIMTPVRPDRHQRVYDFSRYQ